MKTETAVANLSNGEKYNNQNYWWYHGYDANNLHILDTCKRTMFGNKKEAMLCDPMGGSQNNKSRV